MTEDYQKQLQQFSQSGNRAESQNYLEKYWLNGIEYIDKWLSIQKKVFNVDAKEMPEMMFNHEYRLIPMLGGTIFAESDFENLKKCMNEIGEKYFVVVENCYNSSLIFKQGGPDTIQQMLRLKFPTNITWEEISKGGGITTALFEIPDRDYFVFGETGTWGKYVANEYWNQDMDEAGTPLDIIGFKTEYEKIFRANFINSEEDMVQIREWLPEAYKKFL